MQKIYHYLLFLIFISSCATQKLSLSLNLPNSHQFKVRMSQTNDIEIISMGSKQNTLQSQVIDYQYNVINKQKNGDTDFKTSIKDIEVYEKNSQGTTEFNSKESGDRALDNMKNRIYQKMLGQSMNFTLNKNGEILQLSGVNKMFEEIFEEFIQDKKFQDNPMIEQLRDLMIQQLGNEAFKESMDMFINFYPPKPVKINESWSRVDTFFSNLGIIIQTTYTLKKRDKGFAFLELNAVVVPNPSSPGLDLGVMKMQYNLRGTNTGNVIVNEQTGWAKSTNYKQSLSGTILITGDALPSDIESDVNMEGVYSFEKIIE